MAGEKNVPIINPVIDGLVPELLATLDHTTICALSLGDAAAFKAIIPRIDHALDVAAAARIIKAVWTELGFDHLDPVQIALLPNNGCRQELPTTFPRAGTGPDLRDSITAYDACLVRPLPITVPKTARKRTGFQLDRIRSRISAEASPPSRYSAKALRLGHDGAPLPPFIRAGFPGSAIEIMPNARHTDHFDADTTTVTWWKDGKYHREHGEGPAYHLTAAFGERVIYYDAGLYHRPATEGPAVQETHYFGGPVEVIYAEHGIYHRDPSDGPAVHRVKGGVRDHRVSRARGAASRRLRRAGTHRTRC
ncbi:MAG: hypothetical protein WDN31_02590 [Hyphomicrobium sp.]